MGAIETGKTICGILFGGSVYLGYLSGVNATEAPAVKDENRKEAISCVRNLFHGFIERFGDTDCHAFSSCDWSKKEDVKRYFKEKVYENTCYHQFEYVLGNCLEKNDGMP